MMRIAMFMMLAAAWGCTGEPAAPTETVYRSPGKPMHPIQVRVETDDRLRAGVETDARIVVTSARPAATVEVVLLPEDATLISETHFARQQDLRAARGMRRAGPAAETFDFRIVPARDAPQPLLAEIRVTSPDGSVLVREVRLPLGVEKTPRAPRKARDTAVPEIPEAGGDVIVPAEQEVVRGDNS